MAFIPPGQEKWVILPGFLIFAAGLGTPVFAVYQGELEHATTAGYIGGGLFVLAMAGGGLFMMIAGFASRSANARDAQLVANGVAGQATVLSAEQTGLYVNKQPQVELHLRIETPVHGSYEITSRQVVPFLFMGSIGSGRSLPVKVDPNDRSTFVIDWESPGFGATGDMGGFDVEALLQSLNAPGMTASAGLTQHGGVTVDVLSQASSPWASPADREAARRQILATGDRATATVLSATPTGGTDSEGNPVFSIVLFVEIPGHPAVQGAATVGVPLNRVRRVQPGEQLPIRVDRDNPAAMAVDWSQA